MYGRSRVNVKVHLNLAQLLLLHVAFHTLPLFHLRMFAQKNYATVEINHYINNVYFAVPLRHLQRVMIHHLHVSYVTHCRNGCMTNVFFFFYTKQQETHVMIYVSLRREQICFVLGTMNFNTVSD